MMGKQTTLFSCINFLKSQSAKEDEQATVSEEHVEQSEGNHGGDDVPVVALSSTESTWESSGKKRKHDRYEMKRQRKFQNSWKGDKEKK